MTREEWNHVLDTHPATATQVGAIVGEFRRLGVADRGERLALSAALLGLGDLGSTTELVMGQAGQLVATLRHIRDRAELAEVAAAPDDGQDDERDGRTGPACAEPGTLVDVLGQVVAVLWRLFGAGSEAAKPSDSPAVPAGRGGARLIAWS